MNKQKVCDGLYPMKVPKPMKPQKFSQRDREICHGILPGLHLPKQEGEKRGRKIREKELGRPT